MGKTWTTSEQLAWLDGRLPAFIKAKALGQQADELVIIRRDWFKEFPERVALFPQKTLDESLSNEEEKLLGEAVNIRTGVSLNNLLEFSTSVDIIFT